MLCKLIAKKFLGEICIRFSTKRQKIKSSQSSTLCDNSSLIRSSGLKENNFRSRKITIMQRRTRMDPFVVYEFSTWARKVRPSEREPMRALSIDTSRDFSECVAACSATEARMEISVSRKIRPFYLWLQELSFTLAYANRVVTSNMPTRSSFEAQPRFSYRAIFLQLVQNSSVMQHGDVSHYTHTHRNVQCKQPTSHRSYSRATH